MKITINKVANLEIPTIGYTHGGVFHADEVFASAFFRILNPDFKIIRGFKIPDNFDGIVYDIGGGEFDHHQTPRETRPNGIPYAAFGKVVRKYYPFLMERPEYERFDDGFVKYIDSQDNGGDKNPLSMAIKAFNPIFGTNESGTENFYLALKIAQAILEREIASAQSHEMTVKLAKPIKEADEEITIVDRFLPIIGELCNSNAKFFVYPAQRGGWNAQCITVSRDSFVQKCPFPTEWRGLPEEELPDGITFCHASGFLLAAESKEKAIWACQLALDQQKEREAKMVPALSTT